MSYKDFEEHLGDKLRNRSGDEVDNSAMWDKLEAELPVKKKRRRFIFWWPIGVAVILLGGFLLTQENIYLGQEKNTSISEVVQKIDDVTPSLNDEESDLTNAKIETKKNRVLPVNADVSNDVNESQNLSEVLISNESAKKVIKVNEVTVERNPDVLKADENLRKQRENNDVTARRSEATLCNENQELISTVLPGIENEVRKNLNTQDENQNNVEVGDAEKKLNKISETTTSSMGKEMGEEVMHDKSEVKGNSGENNSTDENNSTVKLNENQPVIPEPKDLKNHQDDIGKISKSPEQSKTGNTTVASKPNQEDEKVTKDNTYARWGLGLAFGYYIPKAQYGGNDNDLIDLRVQIEDPLEAIEGALSVSYNFSERWSISSGISFSKINQEAFNTRQSIRDLPGEIIIGQVNTVDGSYYITEPGMVPHNVVSTYRRYVSYSSLAIPVQVHYGNKFKNRWGIIADAGFEYSLKAWQSGYEQDLNGVEYNLSTDTLTRLNDRSSNYLLLGLRLQYFVSTNMNFHVGGQSKFSVSDLYQTNAFQKRYFLPGLTSGFTINF